MYRGTSLLPGFTHETERISLGIRCYLHDHLPLRPSVQSPNKTTAAGIGTQGAGY